MRKLTVGTLAAIIAIMCFTVQNRTGNKTPAIATANTAGIISTQPGGTIYLQRDRRWANDTIGGSDEKFGDVGCTVCCVSMAMEYCGIDIDPGQLNKRLRENNGYTDKGWLKWFTTATVTGNKLTIELPRKPSHEKIDETLKLGYPVIAKGMVRGLNIPHWVLIVAKDAEGYLIKDPLGDGKNLDKFSKYGDKIYSIRIFKSKTSKTGMLKQTPSPPGPRKTTNTQEQPSHLTQYAMPSRHTLKIRSKIDAGPWKTTSAICPLKGQSVTLKVDKIANASIRWYQIIPDITQDYNNANWPWDEKPYQWKGFDKIEYEKKELTSFRGKWQINPLIKPVTAENRPTARTDADKITLSPFYHKDIGSFWYQAIVIEDGKLQRSAGIEETTNQGISPAVFRISIRESEGYIGYLTSFYNVPGLFGSVTAQSNNYIGVDCADVLMAAYGKWKNKPMPKNYNVAMLAKSLTQIARFDMSNGTCPTNLRWQTDIKPGDFIAVKYPSSKQYGHIGALHGDTNKNGMLDENDKIIHAGPSPLHISKIKEGNFNGKIKIIRP